MKTIVVFFATLIASFTAIGQTACPVGVSAGSAQCGPSPAEHITSSTRSEPAPATIRYVPSGEWRKTWGAVAIDHDVGDMGTVVGELSKSEAEKVAIIRCASHGAKRCKVQIAYMNQCVATFFPGVPGGKGLSVGAETIAVATEIGGKKCFDENGSACNRVYTECSAPIFDHF